MSRSEARSERARGGLGSGRQSGPLPWPAITESPEGHDPTSTHRTERVDDTRRVPVRPVGHT